MPSPLDEPKDPGEQVLPTETVRPPVVDAYLETESNNLFAEADLVPFEGAYQLVGSITAGKSDLDLDVYDLGPAMAGDRVLAELGDSTPDGVEIGIFDDQARLLAFADPSNWINGPVRIDITLHESTLDLYAVVATRSGWDVARDYAARIDRIEDAGMPTPKSQVIVLDFDGEFDVAIRQGISLDVPPFDAAAISSAFDGETEEIVELVLAMVREDYAGLDVEVYSADDPALPAGTHSVVYFGSYSDRLLGLSERVDPYNADATQSAIVYTETFSLFAVFSPTTDEIAQVLANVASHEAGHLLGLRHTSDPTGVMDITASARQMMEDQWFSVSPLHPSVISIGVQDAPSLLAWSVGGLAPKPPVDAKSRRQKARIAADDPNDFYIPRHMLSCCGEHDSHDND